jgi:ferredoxin
MVALDGTVSVVEVADGESILEAAIDMGLEVSHDCKMGVCMTCPARLVRPPLPPLHVILSILRCVCVCVCMCV